MGFLFQIIDQKLSISKKTDNQLIAILRFIRAPWPERMFFDPTLFRIEKTFRNYFLQKRNKIIPESS